MTTTKETINNVVWRACDSFRGTMDSSLYKDYILSMLFVKYLSDFYHEKVSALEAKYTGDKAMIQKALQREKFILDDRCTFEYLLKNKESANLGEVINKALERIEEDNPEKLNGIFRNVDFNDSKVLGDTKERNATLKNLLEDFSDPKLDLSPSKLAGRDVIGDSYEYLISHFASDAGKKGGEFYTPNEVSTLLAKLVAPTEGNRIYDPTCGSASLLIKAAKEVGNNNFAIYGQEKNGQTHALSRMNMYLHEINDAKIEWGDTIRNPLHLENDKIMKFDIVVANPPFSLDKWGVEEAETDTYNRFKDIGIPPKSKGDYAFVIHMIKSLNENGKMGVVLPHGVLFRGASEGKIRKKFIDDNLLDAVIGLPANLFFGTGIPATLLIFKKNRKNKDILFIDASREFDKEKNQNAITDEQINKICATYSKRKQIEKYSYKASIEEIQENDYNLNIPRYIDTFEEEEQIDIKATKQQITAIEKELTKVKTQMDTYLKELDL